MTDIFISYSHEDHEVAQRFAEAFAREGLTVWWDVRIRPGEMYDEVIEAALRKARAVVVLWSPRSVASRWVRAEATIADRGRKLVPAVVAPCERPIIFELTQATELSHWRGEPDDLAWRAFYDEVRRVVDGMGQSDCHEQPTADGMRVFAATAAHGPAPAPVPPRRRRPTLAVLPFINRSADPLDDDLAAEMAADITTALSQGRGLRVLAQGVLAAYRDQAIDVRKIGHDHGADYVMEGNVRRVGAMLRVTAQLVDAHIGAILWTRKFDRPASDRLALLDDLTGDLAGHLGVQIQRVEMQRASTPAAVDTPWAAIKRSWAPVPRMTIAGLQEAVVHARRAVELAPEYALALSNLGLMLGVLYQRGGSREPRLLREALEHGDRALQLDGSHGTVLFQVALVKYYAQEWLESLELAERSVEINPHMPDALITLAGALTRYERYDEAIALLDQADRIAPHGYSFTISLINRCWVYYGWGQIAAARDTATRLLQIMPCDHTGLMLRAVFHAELGDRDLARKDMATLRQTYPDEDLALFLGTIEVSRQADAVRTRNAELFRQIWDETAMPAPAPAPVGTMCAQAGERLAGRSRQIATSPY